MFQCSKRNFLFYLFVDFNRYKPIVLFNYGTKANRIAPDVTPKNAASRLRLFCLLTRISSKNEIKMENYF